MIYFSDIKKGTVIKILSLKGNREALYISSDYCVRDFETAYWTMHLFSDDHNKYWRKKFYLKNDHRDYSNYFIVGMKNDFTEYFL